MPAIIYTLFNYNQTTIKGWGIPMATDIAFALGILLWLFLLKSGIHPTIAGVLFGMTLPLGKNVYKFKASILYRFEHILTLCLAL